MKMSIAIPLLFTISLQVCGSTYGQNINYRKKNVKLETLLKELQKQSGYNILYKESLISNTKRANAEYENVAFAVVLNDVLKPYQIHYQIVDDNVVLSKSTATSAITKPSANSVGEILQKRLQGQVLDVSGNALSNVTVTEKGTNNRTSTNGNGNFEIQLKTAQAVLQFTIVGYHTKEVLVQEQNNIKVTMEPAITAMNDVVIVGYGKRKKVNLTGAVSSISGEELQDQPVINLTNVIGGRLSGVIASNPNGKPGSGSSLSIRGLSTLNDNGPLVVIDGIVRADGFGSVDPNDVANITVLKDASAAAVYGARAANGVFLITTKRGNKGKPIITYSGNYGVQNPTLYPKLMSPYQYASVRNQALLNQGYDPNNPAHKSLFYTNERLTEIQQGIDVVNWYDESFKKNSPQAQHNISINGGNDDVKYFASLGYLDQDGMYDNVNYKKYNFRSNVDAKINKNLSVGLNLEGRQQNNEDPGYDANTIFGYVIRVRPVIPAYYPSGRPYDSSGEHPVEAIKSSGYNRRQWDIFSGTGTFDYKMPFITAGLALKGTAAVYRENSSSKSFFTPYNMYTENAEGNITNIKRVGGQTSLTQESTKRSSYTTNISLNYDRTFGLHEISGLALFEQSETVGDRLSASRSDFITNMKDELFASGPANQTINGFGLIDDARRSLVGRVNYAFASKYLFESSFRYDGSYRFASGKQYGLFPAVSAGWRISQEDFFRNSSSLDFIDELKLRASHGKIGNDRVAAFQFADSYSLITNRGPIIDGNAKAFVEYGVYPNINITWEKQLSTNLGLDASLLAGKLDVEFDYFFRTTKDILWSRSRSIPETFGRSLSNENYAEMKSRGFELSVTHKQKLQNWSYNIRLTGSYATNKVTKIDDPANALDYQMQIGRTYGFRTGFESEGLFQSQGEAEAWYGGSQFGQKSKAGDIKYGDLNSDGKITDQDQKIISDYNYTPRIMFGVNGRVAYKAFDLNFLIQGAAQRNVLINGTGRVMFNGGSSNTFAYLVDSWSPENTDAEYPIAWTGSRSINDRSSDVWLKKAAYARLKSIDLGYTFKESLLSKIGISRLKVFVSGSNLFTVSQLKEFDPEVESASGSYYPQQKTVVFGVNLTL